MSNKANELSDESRSNYPIERDMYTWMDTNREQLSYLVGACLQLSRGSKPENLVKNNFYSPKAAAEIEEFWKSLNGKGKVNF